MLKIPFCFDKKEQEGFVMMQVNPRPSYAIEQVTANENGLICKSEQLTLRLNVFSDTIIEIAFTPLSTMEEPRSLGNCYPHRRFNCKNDSL